MKTIINYIFIFIIIIIGILACSKTAEALNPDIEYVFEQDPYTSLMDTLQLQGINASSIGDPYAFIGSAIPTKSFSTGSNTTCLPINSIIQTTYYDGLGQEQEIAVRDGASGKSIVTYKTYDPRGNVSNIWTQVPCSGINTYITTDEMEAAYTTFYDDESNYKEQYIYDNVCLGRVSNVRVSGKDWQNNDGIEIEYLGNRWIEPLWFFYTQTASNGVLTSPLLINPECIIFKRTKDEDGKYSLALFDKSGKLVLSRKLVDNAIDCADTYYVYDCRGNIKHVLPPEASYRFFWLGSNDWESYSYYYDYDIRNNVCLKKLPGCEPVYYVYDRNNLLVYSQDGNQRSQGKWTHNAYDTFGRLAYTAVVSDNRTMEQLQESLMHTSPRVTFNETNGSIFGYTASIENLTSSSILTVNYYDNYDFISNFANDSLVYRNMTGYDSKYTGLIASQSAKGYLTGTATRVLGDTTMLVKSLYYDCHGNVIQSHESNAMGGYEHDYYHLTFTGKPLAVRHEHSTDSTHHVDINTMTYDAMERLLTTTVTHDGEQVDVITNTYDDLGRLVSQSCLNNQQTTNYSYNIRNWVTAIDAGEGVMKQWLHYADQVVGSEPCFNGNISALDWNSNTTSNLRFNRYTYSYDGMNRLTAANYVMYYPNLEQGVNSGENYSTSYTYDLNSNITALRRFGKSEKYSILDSEHYRYGLIDNLAITRDGNQLKKLTDQCDELTYAGAMDFKDGANEQVEYTWDANGNMTSDLNKGLTEIKYNILNLPEKITHSDGHITYITYAADGRKLNVTYKIDVTGTIVGPVLPFGAPNEPSGMASLIGEGIGLNGMGEGGGRPGIDPPVPYDAERVIMTRDYCGNYTYRNGTIERIMMGSGFIQDSVYYVQIKDYQGNVRAVLDQDHNLVERNEYYPYGGLINASDSQLQPYKYSAKELDRENGLDWYDSQARWYDPMLPLTTTQDPLAEKYYSISPYAWCAGNPILRIDPTGKDGVKYIDNDNNKIIECNVVVLQKKLKEIPQNASEKEIKKIQKKNKKISKQNDDLLKKTEYALKTVFDNAKNSSGERVIFNFNIIPVSVSNTNLTKKDFNQINEIAEVYGIPAITNDRFPGGRGYGVALAAVISTAPADGGLLGRANGMLVRTNNNNPFTFGHEMGHTLKLDDNTNNGSLMNSPVGPLSPYEVDEIWENAYEINEPIK